MKLFRQKRAAVSLYRRDVSEAEHMQNSPSPEEWQQWLDDHAGALLLFARQQCRVAADAEDVLQEALVEAWNRISQPGPPPLPLVYGTIRRRRRFRRKRRLSRIRRCR
jgi:DNA-directed RNA polymerase specialized sigma24 family protein